MNGLHECVSSDQIFIIVFWGIRKKIVPSYKSTDNSFFAWPGKYVDGQNTTRACISRSLITLNVEEAKWHKELHVSWPVPVVFKADFHSLKESFRTNQLMN